MNPLPLNRARLGWLGASLALVAVLLCGAVAGRARSAGEPYGGLKVFGEALHHVQNNYVDRVDAEALISGAYQGLMAMLDSDSEYLPPGETRAGAQEAAPADVGITPIRTDMVMRVLSVRPGSPADRAGVRSGWYLRTIAERAAREMTASRAARALAGAEGSTVKVAVVKPGDPKKIELELKRERPPAQPLLASQPRPRLVHVRLLRIDAEALEALRRSLKQAPPDSLILLDLRENAGGSYEEAVRLANLFIEDGVLGRLRERDRERAVYEARGKDRAWSGEVVALVDRGTAGAAEMVAAALKSRGRARLLGEKTAGVGAFQEILELPNGGALRLSVAKYQDPNGQAWHGEGIVPDQVIEPPKTAAGPDPVLDKVLEILAAARKRAA
jgi:carboxyl-terminal processing protease